MGDQGELPKSLPELFIPNVPLSWETFTIIAPFALATGILAVVDIKKNPRKHGMGRAIFGIVMGALGSIVLAFILVAWGMEAR